MSSYTHTYYPSPDAYNWLDALSGDKAQMDPRTFEVHRIPTLAPRQSCQSRLAHRSSRRLPLNVSQYEQEPRILSPKPKRAFIIKWLQSTAAILESDGFEEVPENYDSDIDDSDICSIDEGELEHLCLEAIPPYPKQSNDNTLFGLHQKIHRQIVFTGPLDDTSYPPYVEDRYYSPHPSVFNPSYTYTSDEGSSKTEDGSCTKNVGKLMANKFRKAAIHGAAACRTLREKLGR